MNKNLFKNFSRDRRGNIAIIYGLLAVPMIGVVGVAVDYGRVINARTEMQQAADAAVMYAARQHNKTQSEREAMALQSFDANGGNLGPNINVSKDVQFAGSTITFNASANVPTTFAKLIGTSDVEVGVKSVVSTAGKKLELAIMLDTTGSMGWAGTSEPTKLDELKTALTTMLDIVMPVSNPDIRVSFVPFADKINVGSNNPANYTGRVSPYNDRICAIERKRGPRPNEAPPVYGTSEFWIKTSNSSCSSIAPIVPLTTNRALLDGPGGSTSKFVAHGATAGHLGTQWAWHMLSPLWTGRLPAGSAPAAYTDKGTIKAVVLMTDGVYTTMSKKSNGHSAGCNGNSPCQPAIDEAKAVCSAMKNISKEDGDPIPGYSVNSQTDVNSIDEQAIMIFSVGFGLPSANTTEGQKARGVMTYCASYDRNDNETDPSLRHKHYYFPVTGEDIQNAFAEIGQALSEAVNKPRMVN